MHAAARRSKRKLWITLASPLAGLGLAELVLRLFVAPPAPAPVSHGILFRPSFGTGLTFEHRPGAVRRTEYRLRHGGPAHVVEHAINAQGFRGPTARVPKPRGVFRVACIGDSHTFGTGVAEEDAWPARLGALLHRPSTEVLNCGVSAYDTPREVILLRERVLAFEPDLVLLQYHVNDVGVRSALGLKPADDDPLRHWSDPRRKGIVRHLRASRAIDRMLDALYRSRGALDESGIDMSGYAPSSPGWLAVRAALREARDLLAERQIAFAVVLFPFLLRRDGELTSDAAHREVAAFCAAEGIACFDGGPAFAGRDVDALRVHPLDYHAGAEAHVVFARALSSWLAARLEET